MLLYVIIFLISAIDGCHGAAVFSSTPAGSHPSNDPDPGGPFLSCMCPSSDVAHGSDPVSASFSARPGSPSFLSRHPIPVVISALSAPHSISSSPLEFPSPDLPGGLSATQTHQLDGSNLQRTVLIDTCSNSTQLLLDRGFLGSG